MRRAHFQKHITFSALGLILSSGAAFAETIRYECPAAASDAGVTAMESVSGMTRVRIGSGLNLMGILLNGNPILGRTVFPDSPTLSCEFTSFLRSGIKLYERSIPSGYDQCSASGNTLVCRSSTNRDKRITVSCPETATLGSYFPPAPFTAGETAPIFFDSISVSRTTGRAQCFYTSIDPATRRDTIDNKEYIQLTVPAGYRCSIPLDGAAAIEPTSYGFYAVECTND
jgi:hypothetical protein